MASPATAVGAHFGLLDAEAIWSAFGEFPDDPDKAINAYAPGGKLRASQIYQRSKEVSLPYKFNEGDDIESIRMG